MKIQQNIIKLVKITQYITKIIILIVGVKVNVISHCFVFGREINVDLGEREIGSMRRERAQ